MNQIQTMINKLGGNLFIMDFIETKSTMVRDLYLPSLMYTPDSIKDSMHFTDQEKEQALTMIDSMNDIIMKLFDLPQINLIMAHIVNETIERMDRINSDLSKGKLLSILLDNNRENPTALTREYELNEITRTVHENSLNDFIANAGGSPYMASALENVFSYKLINRICVDTIDLLDTYLFENINN